MKCRTGMGCDRLSPADIERVPAAGLGELAALFNYLEAALVWPQQTQLIIGKLLPKKTEGDRII
eukprot:8197810-Pyramimonas_sp.AAC.1